ncbi:hypothetical protein HDV02_000657 [Globomyces sp. JEL0801]|nr:hypothetical protein HDV02_000657 [Globomyces sp. JEL0801]
MQGKLSEIDQLLKSLPTDEKQPDTTTAFMKTKQHIKLSIEQFKAQSTSTCPITKSPFTRRSAHLLYNLPELDEESLSSCELDKTMRDSGVFLE